MGAPSSHSQYPVDDETFDRWYDKIFAPYDWAPDSIVAITNLKTGAYVAVDDRDGMLAAVRRLGRTGSPVYYTPAPRAGLDTSRWTGQGGRTAVREVAAIWADLDTSDGQHASDTTPTMAEAKAALRAHPIGLPTLTVATGGGLHAYWALPEPVSVDDPAYVEARESHAEWLAAYFRERGQSFDVGVTRNPAGLLRVPGAINEKYGTVVSIVGRGDHAARIYSVDAYDVLPPAPAARTMERPRMTADQRASDDRPGTAFARDVPADVLLRDLWDYTDAGSDAMTSPDGLRAHGRWYPSVRLYDTVLDESGQSVSDGIRRVVAFSETTAAAWGVEAGQGHCFSSWGLLVQVICGGDAGLAARIVSRLRGNGDAIVAAVRDANGDVEALSQAFPFTEAAQARAAFEESATTALQGQDEAPGMVADDGTGDDDYWQAVLDDAPHHTDDEYGYEEEVEPSLAPSEAESAVLADTGVSFLQQVTTTQEVSDESVTDQVVAAGLEQTDQGLAQRVAAYEGSQLRWTPTDAKGGGSWHVWDGRVWVTADAGLVRERVLRVTTHVAKAEAQEYGKAVVASKLAEVPQAQWDVKGGDGSTPRKAAMAEGFSASQTLARWARQYETKSKLDSVITLLASLPALRVEARQWNADRALLNTPRGVIHLDTLRVTPHDPRHLMTQITAGSGDLSASLDPLQPVLLQLALEDPDLPEFVGTVAGIATTGYAPALFCHVWGAAGIGKSSLWEAVRDALGTYALTGTKGFFERKRAGGGDGPTPGLHAVRGKRFVYVDEASNVRLDEDIIKALSSGGKVATRTLHAEHEEWRSSATLVMSGNDPVKLPADDAGIARRFYPIHMSKPLAHDDPAVRERLIDQAGLDAVLAWAAMAAHRWIQAGRSAASIAAPECVIAGRRSYLSEQDLLQEWLDTQTTIFDAPQEVSNESVTAGALHVAYCQWATYDHRQVEVLGITRFRRRLRAMGLVTTNGREYRKLPNGRELRDEWCDRVRLQVSTESVPEF